MSLIFSSSEESPRLDNKTEQEVRDFVIARLISENMTKFFLYYEQAYAEKLKREMIILKIKGEII